LAAIAPLRLSSTARDVEEGWAANFNELLADALRRFLASFAARVTADLVMADVQWCLHGND